MKRTDPLRHRRQWARFASRVKVGLRRYSTLDAKPHLRYCVAQLKYNGSARRFITLHSSKHW